MPSLDEIIKLDKEKDMAIEEEIKLPRMKLAEALFIAICTVQPGFSEKYPDEERQRAVEELKRLYEFIVGQHDFSVVL